eukprot:7432435-Pyramimonas_sp.AAC.1
MVGCYPTCNNQPGYQYGYSGYSSSRSTDRICLACTTTYRGCQHQYTVVLAARGTGLARKRAYSITTETYTRHHR